MTTSVLPEPAEAPRLVPQPGSATWRIAADGRLLLGAGYALTLQVAHPVVGAGVAEHSAYREDPWGRLWRTLDYVNVTVFGGPEAAAEMGRRVRGMHRSIKGVRPDGERYHALEPEAFAWVHATLAHAILRCQDVFGARPTAWEREAFYADWRRLGRLVGVRERDLPAGLAPFEAYVQRMVDEVLDDNETVQGVLESLSEPARPPVPLLTDPAWRMLRAPATRGVRLVTTGLLPPVLRERFGLPWSRANALEFAALSASQRAATPLLPRRLRRFGPTYLRWRGDAIRAAGIPL
jgi:uncharacterized protein (DUF2236 family)